MNYEEIPQAKWDELRRLCYILYGTGTYIPPQPGPCPIMDAFINTLNTEALHEDNI